MHTFCVVELPYMTGLRCSRCREFLGRGRVFVETFLDGVPYVYAHLVRCCGDPKPVPILFDSHEPAQEAANRLFCASKNAQDIFNLPLVRRSSVPNL